MRYRERNSTARLPDDPVMRCQFQTSTTRAKNMRQELLQNSGQPAAATLQPFPLCAGTLQKNYAMQLLGE
jgi:hypothetical protein